jgi:outer membrane murein-binding lipoprotein Lpp
MGVLKRKTHMVSFRLTEEEYSALVRTCVANGARSVSDFTRDRMCEVLFHDGGPNGKPVEAKVEELRSQVRQLNNKVKRLAQRAAGAD